MPIYEYKVVPAPSKGQKARGIRGPQARFALALEQVMNDLAGSGWEFLRSDTLPSEERQGLTGSVTQYRTMLIFRRAKPEPEAQAAPVDGPRLLEAPAPETAPRLTAERSNGAAAAPAVGAATRDAAADPDEAAPDTEAKVEAKAEAPEPDAQTPVKDGTPEFRPLPDPADNGVEDADTTDAPTHSLLERARRLTGRDTD